MTHSLYIVTGAPGAGKSTTLEAFLHLNTPFIAFDIDWLTLPASHLADKDVIFDASTGPAYRALWFAILGMIARNHKLPVFFTALSPQQVMLDGQPPWCMHIAWLLLDCDDRVRQQRLRQRPEWTNGMIEEAINDAAALRQIVQTVINTNLHSPEEVAGMLVRWLESSSMKDENLRTK